MLTENKKNRLTILELAGDFNPKIFQPAWFSQQNLLGLEEAEQADITIIHPDISSFSIGSGITFEITRSSFRAAVVKDVAIEKMFDVAINAFKVLSHTPILKYSIETSFYYQLENQEDVKEFEKIIIPNLLTSVVPKPTLVTFEIASVNEEAIVQKLAIQVPEDDDSCIYFEVDETVSFESTGKKTLEIVAHLNGRWKKTLAASDEVCNKVWENYEKERTSYER